MTDLTQDKKSKLWRHTTYPTDTRGFQEQYEGVGAWQVDYNKCKEAASLKKKGQIYAIVLYNKKPTTVLKMISPQWIISSITFHTTQPKASRIVQDSKNINSSKHISETQASTANFHTFSVSNVLAGIWLCCFLTANAFPFNFTL